MAHCICANPSQAGLCLHAVALLFHLFTSSQAGMVSLLKLSHSAESPNPPSAVSPTSLVTGQHHLTQRLLGMFHQAPRPQPTPGNQLLAEFGLTPIASAHQAWLGLSLRIGEKRLQFVPKIEQFVGNILNQKDYTFSRTFSYDPKGPYLSLRNGCAVRRIAEDYKKRRHRPIPYDLL